MSKEKLKTNKSVLKRFKISSTGKMQRRSVRMNHFNAKDTGSMRRHKRTQTELPGENKISIKHQLPYNNA
ncbi:MAG: 50S ribosomal protein L35 [Candidatus Paceibacterota bacterium]